MDAAREGGERVRLLTITAPGHVTGPEYLREFQVGFNSLRTNLRKSHGLREYAGVVEFQERGAPHLHLMFTGEFIHWSTVKAAVVGRTHRLGKVTDIRPAEDEGIAGYMSKEVGKLTAYLAKSQVDTRVKALRFHPLRKSRGWYPGGMAAAEAAVRRRWLEDKPTIEADDWQVVYIADNGKVKPLNRSKAAEVLPLPIGAPLPVDGAEVALAA